MQVSPGSTCDCATHNQSSQPVKSDAGSMLHGRIAYASTCHQDIYINIPDHIKDELVTFNSFTGEENRVVYLSGGQTRSTAVFVKFDSKHAVTHSDMGGLPIARLWYGVTVQSVSSAPSHCTPLLHRCMPGQKHDHTVF